MKAKTIVLTLLISLGLCMNVNAQEKEETESIETVDSVLNSIYNKSDSNKVHIKTTYVLDDTLKQYAQYSWQNRTEAEKKAIIQETASEIAFDLGVEKPKLEFYTDKDDDTHAQYNMKKNTIYINDDILYSGMYSLKAVAHEVRHCYQWQYTKVIEQVHDIDLANKLTKFKDNFNNYVRAEDNFEAYDMQIIEQDADEYDHQLYEELILAVGVNTEYVNLLNID